jgi:hypothetical protein
VACTEERALRQRAPLRVQGRRRLVQHKDAGVTNEGPCEAHPLLLTTRQLSTALTHLQGHTITTLVCSTQQHPAVVHVHST